MPSLKSGSGTQLFAVVVVAADVQRCRRLLDVFQKVGGVMSPLDGSHQFVAESPRP